jgi:hypothetical protein
MDGIATYVRDEWSQHGVEVGSRGVSSLTLKLPPEVPALTELIAELWDVYGATVSLRHTDAPCGATLTVRMPEDAPIRTPPEGAAVFPFVVAGTSLLVSLCACVVVYATPDWFSNISDAE